MDPKSDPNTDPGTMIRCAIRTPPKWVHFGGHIIVYIYVGHKYGRYPRTVRASIPTRRYVRDQKHVNSGGIPDPPLERVFGKTGGLTQSLYARARIGIVSQGQIWVEWTPFRPWMTPDPTVITCISHTRHPTIPWCTDTYIYTIRYTYE